MDEVCIIGAGPTGILSAKISLEYGLKPFVLEKSSSFGGLWNAGPSQVGVWASLRTNISRHSMTYSDHLWAKGTPVFPTGKEYMDYISSYVSKHDLMQYFHFNSTVLTVEKNENGYLVSYTSESQLHSKSFKYILLATGLMSKPRYPIKKSEVFTGEIMHSAYYREPSIFQGKNVVVIGRSYSAGDIAYEATQTATSVTQVYKRKVVCIKRLVDGIPYDFHLINFLKEPVEPDLKYSRERNSDMVRVLSELCGNPGEIRPDWHLSEEDIRTHEIHAPVSEVEYYEAVKHGQVNMVRGSVTEFYEHGIVLEDGSKVPADYVLLATGYTSDYDYLSDEIKQIVSYDPADPKIPVTLYRNMVHPALPGLAFVGKIHTLIVAELESSAEIGIKWVKGELHIPAEELWEGVRFEASMRTELKDSLWVYDSYAFQRELLKILKLEIDYDWLSSIEYSKGPMSAVLLFKNRPGQEATIQEFVKQIKEEFPSFDFN